MLQDIITCFGKDFKFYFRSKMVYLVLGAYVVLSVGFTLYASNFYQETTINLYQFFKYQLVLSALFIPSLTMRFFADEYKHNTLEVVLSQPMSYASLILGKFLAAWSLTGIMLLSTMFFWLIAALLVSLDNLWVAANYLVTFIAAGSLCALCTMAASFCYSVWGAFLLSTALCLLMVSINFSGWINGKFGSFITMLDFTKQFDNMIMGQAGIAGVLYFVLLGTAFLAIGMVSADYKRD